MKKEEIRKQTWKYFWRQKIQEVGYIALSVPLLYLLSLFGRFVDVLICGSNTAGLLIESINTFWEYFAYSLIGILSLAIILIVLGLVLWILYQIIFEGIIMSNWNKAEKRAKKEYKTKRTTKK